MSDWGNFLFNLVDAILKDGPVGGLGPTRSTQTAILELVGAAGLISSRSAPVIEARATATGSGAQISAVLKAANPATPPAFISAGAQGGGAIGAAPNNLVVPAPAAIVAGNLLVAAIATQTTFTWSNPGLPAGWNLADRFYADGLNEDVVLVWKQAAAGDVGAVSFAFSTENGIAAGGFWGGAMAQYSGVDFTSGPFAAPGVISTWIRGAIGNGPTVFAGPALSGPYPANSLLLSWFFIGGGPTINTPSSPAGAVQRYGGNSSLNEVSF